MQRNPHAGIGQRKRQLRALVRRLHQRGLRPRMFRRREQLQKWMSSPENLAQLRCLVAAGGDGTVGDLITRYPGVPLAVFPMGTENLLAKFLKVPRSGEQLADLIVDGETRRLDLAQVGERRFCLMASVGFDAEIVREVHAARRGNIRRWQYVGPIWRAWWRSMQMPRLRIFCDDEPQPITGRSMFVINQPAYALRFQIAPTANGLDGLLDLRIYDWSSRWELLWLAWNAWRGGWERLPQVTSRTARRLRVDSDRPVPLQIDGDPLGETPVEIATVPDALAVYAP
ncbi:MAG: diacylglycerol kinase family protein [Planctomycetaceae bacterium]